MTRIEMKWYSLVLIFLFLFSLGAACLSAKMQNADIQVNSDDLDSFTPTNVGTVDFYTVNVRVENPTNRTFDNVEVIVTLMPTTAYCHSQTSTFEIPSISPYQKLKEVFSFSEFANLDCAYNFSSSVTSDAI